MARRPSKHLRPARPLLATAARTQSRADGTWVVSSVPAGRSTKEYRCPGCNQRVPAGAAHVVAWPHQPRLGSTSSVEDRRHWHSACWDRSA